MGRVREVRTATKLRLRFPLVNSQLPEGPRGQVDVAGDRRLAAKADEDRVPLAVGHRCGLRILDADDIEVVMRPFEVDAICQGGRRETRGDEDCGEYRKALH